MICRWLVFGNFNPDFFFSSTAQADKSNDNRVLYGKFTPPPTLYKTAQETVP